MRLLCFTALAIVLSVPPLNADLYRAICVDNIRSRQTIAAMNDFFWPRADGQTVSVHYGYRLRAFRHFYIPSLGSANKASQEAQRIRELGFTDVRWIRVNFLFDGETSLQHGVSLGLYENEAAADSRLKSLHAQGIKPSIREGFNRKEQALSLETLAPVSNLPEILSSWKSLWPDHPLQLDSSVPEGELDCQTEPSSPLKLPDSKESASR